MNTGQYYFDITYENARKWAESHVSVGRKRAIEARNWVLSMPWPGRSGSINRRVLLAHIHIAERCGKLYYSASCRELANIANVSRETASNSTRHLIEQELIQLVQAAKGPYPNRYCLSNTMTITQSKDVRVCQCFPEHDVFCYRGFGKSGKEICDQLIDGPKTVKQLIQLTGRHSTTIKKRLLQMSRIIDQRTGELHSLVYEEDDCWLVDLGVNLDLIAQILGLNGQRRKREWRYQKETKEYQSYYH